MLDAHYSGRINISDYWDIGDIRTESISEITIEVDPNGGQPAQDIQLVIIGISHDDLESELNGVTKSAVTIQTLNCLSRSSGMDNGNGSPYACWSTTFATVNSTLYTRSYGRDFCNNEFIGSLPQELTSLLRPVVKLSNRYANSKYKSYSLQETTTDKIFFISASELFGDDTNTQIGLVAMETGDGTQYEYYETNSNRIKETGTSMQSSHWWTRTSYIDTDRNTGFIAIGDTGQRVFGFDSSYGIAPAFCL